MQKNKNKQGFILTAEAILITTILVIGLTVGLVSVRNGVVAELQDVAESIGSLSQSFGFAGIAEENNLNEPFSITAGSSFLDLPDNVAGDQAGIIYTTEALGEIGQPGTITGPLFRPGTPPITTLVN